MTRRLSHVVLAGVVLLTAWLYVPMLSAVPAYEDVTPTVWHGWHLFQVRGLATTSLNLQALLSLPLAHAWQIGLHLLNGLLIAWLLEPVGAWRAVLVASVYLVHPLAVESVTPLAYRADLLLVTCVLLMLGATRFARWSTVATLAALAGAVLMKESGLVAVPLLLLWLWITDDPRLRWALRVLPLAAMAGALVLAARFLPRLSTWTSPAPHGLVWFDAVQAAAVWRYVGLMVWPDALTVDHDFSGVGQATALLAAMVLGAVLAITAKGRRRIPALTFGAWWVALSLAPHFLIPLPDYLKEHHWNLASLGIYLGAGLTGVKAHG